jgi:hypothetical protein
MSSGADRVSLLASSNLPHGPARPDRCSGLLGPILGSALSLGALVGCGEKASTPAPQATPAPAAPSAPAQAPERAAAPAAPPAKRGLVLALSRFAGTTPQPARAELLTPQAGLWKSESFDDPDSNVFHKAFAFDVAPGTPALITLGGMKAAVKAWQRKDSGFEAQTLWTEAFGGKFDRMRDAEVGDVDGDGALDIAVGTHDQGVVAYLKHPAGKDWEVVKLDREPDTYIHEIELGDLNGDGALEIYATPSEPNRLDAGAQSGRVVRYVPKLKQGRTVVADLGKRHAKEILVRDLDGDGRDELYVAVEALTEGSKDAVKIVEPVEIRRYDADTPPDKGKVVARIEDRFCRFLTAGDVDGDGKKELVAAAFHSGVWLLRPRAATGKDVEARGSAREQNKAPSFELESIDKESSGFEHAALLADLDEDGKDELYVAADDQGELRRYVWQNGKPVRETILKRDKPRETWTWNIMPLPGSWLAK